MFRRILIVDDNPAVRFSVRRCIEANTTCDVCGEADNGHSAIEMVVQLNPDIVLLDFQMPLMNGLDAAREIARLAPKTTVLLFTMHESEQLVQAARAVGVRKVISKSASLADHLLACLHSMTAEN